MCSMPNSLSVMTYNICDGGQERLELIRQVIASVAPQLVLLNEADDKATIEKLANGLGMECIWARGSGTKHIALLSHLPIVRWQVYNRRPITQALLEAEIEIGESPPLRVYGVHLLPYFMFLPYELSRWRSVSAILKVTKRVAGPQLLMGDFNAVAPGDSADLSIFPRHTRNRMLLQANRMLHVALRPIQQAGYTDCFRSLHRKERGWTWMPQIPSARLDYIYADAEMAARLRRCEMVISDVAKQASDHFPLLAQFE
jgi:exodeoxyribonuclease III